VYSFPTPPDVLTCYLSAGTTNKYQAYPCTYSAGNVVAVTVGALEVRTYTLIVTPIVNPTSQESSSQFRLRTLQSDVVIDYNEVWGQVTFA
jgi:hypothetical protein